MNRAARGLGLCLGFIIGAGSFASAPAAPPALERDATRGIVLAQVEREPRKRQGIFRFLFRNREERQQQRMMPRRELRVVPRREREAAPKDSEQPRRQSRRKQEQGDAKPRKQRKNRPAAAATPREAEPVEKAADAKRVLVMGDFMGGALAKGLTQAFEQNANVVVVDATKGDSGLVRADFYDWTAELPALMEAQKPDAMLMLIGANDRQAINTEAGSQAPGTDGWRLAYASRVSALADALKATVKPVLWAGLAPVKSSAMSRDYSALNGIVREQLESRGMRYVDIWNGFADETGKFVSEGPDVSGQPAQLREDDGLNFSKAGQRKLAFFVERELNELLGTATPLLASTAPTEPANIEPADQAPRIGPMIPLDTVAVAGDALSAAPMAAAAQPEGGTVAATVTNRLGGQFTSATPAGRADDFSWPPRPLPAAAITPAAAAAPAPAGTSLAAPPGPSAAGLSPAPQGSPAPVVPAATAQPAAATP